jgi:hypothetical protein
MHPIQPQVATTTRIGIAASMGALLLGGGAKGKRSALLPKRSYPKQATTTIEAMIRPYSTVFCARPAPTRHRLDAEMSDSATFQPGSLTQCYDSCQAPSDPQCQRNPDVTR